MSIAQIPSLTKYSNELKAKLADKTVPMKQLGRPVQYREFLERELKKVTTKLEALSFLVPSKK